MKPGPFGFGGDVTTSGAPVVGAVRVRPERTGGQMRARQRISRVAAGSPASGCTSTGCPRRLQGRDAPACLPAPRPRCRRTVGESCAVRVGEPPCRQARVAPELLRVDAALLERGVDERLQQPRGQQVDQHHLEERAGRDGLGQRRGELAQRGQHVDQVVLALPEDVADGVQLLEHVVEVRVVVDEARRPARRTGSPAPAAC